MDIKEAVEELSLSVRARIPIIAISTKDEGKSLELVKQVASNLQRGITVWSITGGDKSLKSLIDDAAGGMVQYDSQNRSKIYVVYDLCDLIKTDILSKRSLIDKHPQISGCRNVIITFTESNPGISWIYPMKHEASPTKEEVQARITELMTGIDKQIEYFTNGKEKLLGSEEKIKEALSRALSVKEVVTAQLKDQGETITTLLGDPRSNLSMQQIEAILSQCLISKNFTFEYVAFQVNKLTSKT